MFFIYQNLSAKYYQENRDRLQKKACERYQNLSKEEKTVNMVVKVQKSLRRWKKKKKKERKNPG